MGGQGTRVFIPEGAPQLMMYTNACASYRKFPDDTFDVMTSPPSNISRQLQTDVAWRM